MKANQNGEVRLAYVNDVGQAAAFAAESPAANNEWFIMAAAYDRLLGSALFSWSRVERDIGFPPGTTLESAMRGMVDAFRRSRGGWAREGTCEVDGR